MQVIKKEHPKLYKESEFSSFLGISPKNKDGYNEVLKNISGKDYPRRELITCLLDYNKEIGNDKIALQNIEKLTDGFCVFTGQQIGVMGSPAYTILKAVSAILLAREIGACPIFWLATEDHDIDEIDHTYLFDTLCNLQKTHLSLPKDGRMPEDLEISPQNLEALDSFCKTCNIVDLIDRKEKSYSLFHAKLFAKLFRGTGLVFIEPNRLRSMAKPFFVKEIEEADAILQTLQTNAEALEKKGFKPPLDVSKGTNLFFKTDGKYRSKIQKSGKDFIIGKKKYEKAAILDLIEKEPALFSAGVKARCVLQSQLFPTIAYVAGPNELNYYHQLREYHAFHGVFMPWIVPRISATFINPKARLMLDKFRLEPWGKIPDHYADLYPEIETRIESFTSDLLKTADNYLGKDLKQETINHYIHDMAKKFKRKLTMELLKKEGLPNYSLHYLKNLLHPHNTGQERIFNWFEFQRFSSENLIKELLDKADLKFDGHHYCFLS